MIHCSRFVTWKQASRVREAIEEAEGLRYNFRWLRYSEWPTPSVLPADGVFLRLVFHLPSLFCTSWGRRGQEPGIGRRGC